MGPQSNLVRPYKASRGLIGSYTNVFNRLERLIIYIFQKVVQKMTQKMTKKWTQNDYKMVHDCYKLLSPNPLATAWWYNFRSFSYHLQSLISPHNRPHNTGTGRCNTYYTLKGLERAPPYTTQALLIEQSKEPEKQRIQHVCFSFVVGNTKGQHEFTISELNLAQHELTISELNLAWQGPAWAHYTYTYIIHIIH